jgi:hypothetical protein
MTRKSLFLDLKMLEMTYNNGHFSPMHVDPIICDCPIVEDYVLVTKWRLPDSGHES